MNHLIPAVKGARDFYPEDKIIHSWLNKKIQQVSEQFGYQEYDGPFLEKIDLYAAKSGEELVKEQAFVLTDRGGDLLTLRPELTPSLARMVAQRQNMLIFPLRWWSFGPFWRYERPQKGRSREFFQWNIDMIGVNASESDAELIGIAISFLKHMNLTPEQVVVRVNDRVLMDQLIIEAGIPVELKRQTFKWIDRSDKMQAEAWIKYGLELGLSEANMNFMTEVLNNKTLWKRSPSLTRIFELLACMGLDEYVIYDAHIIRGLDYYTGVVFEANDLDGGRALLGGGHYDNLVEDVGGEPLPGVGFAMGDVMITLTLEKYGLIPDLSFYPQTCMVTVFDENTLKDTFTLASRLRQAGVSTLVYPVAAKLVKQFKFADKLGIQYVLVQGPDEIKNSQITLKDLKSGNQETLSFEEALKILLQG